MSNRFHRVDPAHEFNGAPHKLIPIISGYDQPTPGVKSHFVRRAEELVAAAGATRAWSDPLSRSSIWQANSPAPGLKATVFFIAPRKVWTVDRPLNPRPGEGISVPLFYQDGPLAGALADVWTGDHVTKLMDGLALSGMSISQISKQLAALPVPLDADQNASIRALSADRSTHIMAFDFNGGVLVQVADELIPIPGPDISLSVERALNLVDRYAIAGDFKALRSIAAIVKPKRQQRRTAVSIPEVTPPAWNQLPAV